MVLVGSAVFVAGLAAGVVFAPDASKDTRPHRAAARNGAAAQPEGRLGGPGPAKKVNGAPTGFAHSEAGAVAAAASFVTTGQELLDMEPLAAEAAIRETAAAATADDQAAGLLNNLAAVKSALSGGDGPIWYRQAVLAWRVDDYGAERARVATWNVSVLSRADVAPPQATWAISTFDLVWERDDWRVWAESTSPGPAPLLDGSALAATNDQLDSALFGFTDFEAGP
ncbi:MAG TPA: hypothetical protein VMY88_06995 [Acidimicrobiales bacterium]|nr:hypothetical protein [Acidimicrobiales bacterium]